MSNIILPGSRHSKQTKSLTHASAMRQAIELYGPRIRVWVDRYGIRYIGFRDDDRKITNPLGMGSTYEEAFEDADSKPPTEL